MSQKREWYVAVCPTGGEYAGGPPALDIETEIYGPYTHEHAQQAEAIGEQAPDETFTVVIFRADSRPPIHKLLKMLRNVLKDAEESQEENGE